MMIFQLIIAALVDMYLHHTCLKIDLNIYLLSKLLDKKESDVFLGKTGHKIATV